MRTGDPVNDPAFSWGAWVGGFFVALIAGLILNFAFGFFAFTTTTSSLSMLVELIPGALFALMSFRRRRDPFPQGFWWALPPLR